MSILSRQILRHIKRQKLHEFDPYILSTQIDEDMWSPPSGVTDHQAMIEYLDMVQ